jgi:hypothetical protein
MVKTNFEAGRILDLNLALGCWWTTVMASLLERCPFKSAGHGLILQNFKIHYATGKDLSQACKLTSRPRPAGSRIYSSYLHT